MALCNLPKTQKSWRSRQRAASVQVKLLKEEAGSNRRRADVTSGWFGFLWGGVNHFCPYLTPPPCIGAGLGQATWQPGVQPDLLGGCWPSTAWAHPRPLAALCLSPFSIHWTGRKTPTWGFSGAEGAGVGRALKGTRQPGICLEKRPAQVALVKGALQESQPLLGSGSPSFFC